MSDDAFTLFDIGGSAAEAPAGPSTLPELPIRPEQVEAIRAAFQKAGIVEQDHRKSLIESVVIREVASLHDLRAIEAHRILKRIEDRGSSGPKATGSAWDTREEDTWIDKL